MIVKITAHPNALHVRIAGDFDLDKAKQNFLEIIASLEENRREKVLIDGREVVGDPALVERFYYGEFAAGAVEQLRDRAGYDQNPQFAYVLHEPVLDPLRFGETVAANRGMFIKAFDNLEKAVAWLGLAADDLISQEN